MEKINFKLVEENYSIKIERIKQIKTNAYFIKTKDKKEYFLKLSRVDKSHVDFIMDIYSHLKKTLFKSHLIDFERTINGGFYFLDNFGRVCLLCKWIDGRGADYKTFSDLKVIVSILDRLHTSTTCLAKQENRMHLPCYEEVFQNKYSQIKTMENIIHQKEIYSTFDRYFLRAIHRFEDRFAECIQFMKKIGSYFRTSNQKVLIHHDPAHHNFIFTEDNVYLIDFDYAVFDYDVHDFVNLGVRILKTNEWNIDIFKFYLKLLKEKDIPKKFWFEVFWILMFFPQEIWQVGLQYYFEKQPWTEEYFLKRLKGATEIQTRKEMIINKVVGGKLNWP